MLNSSSALNFQQFDIYILDTFGEILWLWIPSNGQECEKFLAVAMHGHPKNYLNMVNIYVYQIAGNLVLSTNLAIK